MKNKFNIIEDFYKYQQKILGQRLITVSIRNTVIESSMEEPETGKYENASGTID
mgnify:CR=1 FL=1